ncbi:MAG: SagB/ThcOx family dehydrogenase [Bacteroidales bacterium]|jgi:SagB-type dehydrogenase family enzyme|nr:SagB/ThcOx family dehydrogenase [Bacteroidales bacterium]
MKKLIIMAIILAVSGVANAQKKLLEAKAANPSDVRKEIHLPEPQRKGGMPLMECLNERKTLRDFHDGEKLDEQMLSNFLWASYGISREDGRRTAPTARNAQDIDLYVVTKQGVYRWESTKNVLFLIKEGDFRKLTGPQPFVPMAQWNVAIVSDLNKYGNPDDINALKYGAMSAGYVSENMYLFCSAFKLATVARGMFDQKEMKALLQLKDGQMVMLVQSVGMPK